MFIAKVERTSADECAVGSLRKNGSGYQNYFPIPLVRIVGRDEEVSELSDKLLSKRFVTITGTGGVGKTVVALTVAHALQDKFRDGARLVDLASLSNPAMVAARLGTMLKLPTPEEGLQQHLVAYLAARNMLIVFDNCERVIDGVARIAEAIFQGAPEAHILATSREPLRATGEWVLRLAPLAVPPASSEMTAAEALRFPAVELFAQYARAGELSYRISDSDAAIVAQTCAKLDGLPLAIELAATRVQLLGLRGLADRLDDRFRILTKGRRRAHPRHETLGAMIDWSYEMLSSDEKAAWRRVAMRRFTLGQNITKQRQSICWSAWSISIAEPAMKKGSTMWLRFSAPSWVDWARTSN